MSLKGGKLIWVNKKDKREKIIKLKNKKNFKFGYYMTNDFILENAKSKPVQCEIVADAFNRISIVNCSKQNPILLNGFPVKTRRPLLHGNKIKIFDEEFVWQFPKNGRNKSMEAEKNNEHVIETPIKNQYESVPAPSSEPWKKRNKERIRARLSAHSFVQSQGNETSEESDQEADGKTSTSVQITNRNTMINRKSNINELSKQLKLRRTFDYETPIKKWDDTTSLIKFDTSFSQNKENTRKNSLQLCKSSGTLVTSYSPQIQNDTKSNSSFAYVKSNKNTPKSVYCTPKSVLSELGNDQDIEMSLDLINFSTPRAKYIENNGSMFLIDLTTPAQTANKVKNDSAVNKTPINVQVSKTQNLKSVLKNPNISDVSKSMKKVKMSLGNNERSPLQVKDRNPKRLKLSATPSPTLTLRKSLSLSCTKIVKNNINEINFTPNKAALSLENSKNFPKASDLSDAEKINISNKIVHGSFNSFETIDNTINLDDASTLQEEHESSVIEVSDDSSNIFLKSLNNSLNDKSASQKLNVTPQLQKNHKTPQSLMKKVLISSARKVANNSLNSPAILNTASTPIHVKKLSLSFGNSNDRERKLSNIERKSTRFSLNSSLVTTTPLSNRKSIKTSSLIKSAPLNRSIKNIEKSNITAAKQRKSIYKVFTKDETRHTPKRHSCGNTRLARTLLTPTEMKSNKKISRNSSVNLNSTKPLNTSLQSKIINTRKSAVIEYQKHVEISPKLVQHKSSNNNTNTNNTGNVEKNEVIESKDVVFEISALNETFSIDSDSENLETQQSDEHLSMTNSENKVFKSLTKNKSSDIEKDMNRVKKILEPNKENIEYETNIQETLKLTNSKNDEKNNIQIKNRKKISNPKVMSTPKMDGIKHLMSTPKVERTPILEGLKETLKTPKLITSNITNSKKLRSSLKTPNFQDDEVNLSGIQELLKTPIENKSEKINNSSRYLKSIVEEETEGLDSIFKTPSAKTIMVSEKACRSTATKKYLISPSENILNPSSFEREQEIELDNPDPLFDVSLQNFQAECGSTPRTTLDTSFDKLVGNRPIIKSYSNKKSSSKTEFKYTIDVDTSSQNAAKSDVQEWVENITSTTLQNFEKSENNGKMKNISSDSDEINVSGIDILNISCKTLDSVDESLNDKTSNSSATKVKEFNKSTKENNSIEDELYTPYSKKRNSRSSRKTIVNDKSFNLKNSKEKKELAFENLEDQPKLIMNKSFTPELQKIKSRIPRKSLGKSQILDSSFDLEVPKEQREREIVFENFEEQPNLIVHKSFTPDNQKTKSRITRKTMGNNQIMDSSFDLEAAKDQRETEIAFENFEEQPNLTIQKSFTPDVQKRKSRTTRKTMGNNQIMDSSFDLEAAKEQREKEIAFENFEEQPNLIIQKSFTPDIQKTKSRITRKTMGNNQIMDSSFDLEAAKDQRETEIAFENFEEQPNLTIQKSFTPAIQKTKSRITRKTMGNNQIMDSSFDLEAAKEQREKEIAFENFEEQPNLIIQKSFTPDIQKTKSRITRKTMGNNQIMHSSFDLEAAKEQREKEILFENFEDQPKLIPQKSFTPEVQKTKSRISRKTMGNNQMDSSFDLGAAKEQREKEIAFENFEEQPNLIIQKSFTPDIQKTKSRITRKTMGNNQIMDSSFDLEAAKEQREKEILFENFEDQPKLIPQKSFTPEVQKTKSRISRKTMGNNQMDSSFDLEAAKEQREKEIAFENFEEQPNLIIQKSFTPYVQKTKSRITRKTMGNNQIMDSSFDLEAAKEEREKEIAFEYFEDQPKLIPQKSFTPEVQKTKSRMTRKTMGNNQIMDSSFDLEAAKEKRETEIAFENFEDQPNFIIQKSFTPDIQKTKSRITRKTMGNNQIMDSSFDLEAAKEQREKEIAFEYFEDQPKLIPQKSFTPEVQKTKSRISRKTMGNNQIMDSSFDLEAAKGEREKEIAFENFENQPKLIPQKSFTPEVQKTKSRITRKTMGNNQIMDSSFDLEAAKEQRETEIAFENFEEQPNLIIQKSFTPDIQKTKSRITRKTMGNNQIMDSSFDLEAAKEQREMEIAFENFEEQPKLTPHKSFTPEVQKTKSRITRKTMGNNQVMDSSFDLEAAKEQRETEIAFENFEAQPSLIIQKAFTPDIQKTKSRITRKTMGNNQIMDSSFDLEAAKEQREKEILFENFEDQPKLIPQKSFTPEVQKTKSRISRKTMGNNQIMDSSFDLEAAKEQREKEILFENFEDHPKLIPQKSFTPEVQKTKSRISRKTMGNNQIMDSSFDLEAAKDEREKEIAFENFEEQPSLIAQKSFTPKIQKKKSKITRKTMGNNQIMDSSFDLEAAKKQREKEILFEKFEDQPKLIPQKSFTPEVSKAKSRICRKTMGNNQILDPSFDLEAAKDQREKEIAFENFEDQPKLITQKSFTPEVQKRKSKITRKTMGNNQIMDLSFDLKAAKEQREKEIAFENFEDQPKLISQKSFTPQFQKTVSRIPRRTMANNQILNSSFDLKALKEQNELELAFKNFEEQPKLISTKSFTPEVQKIKSRITRKTMGNNKILDVSFDLEAAKAQREKEIAFENFEKQPKLFLQKSFTPEVQKAKIKISRKTIGNNQILVSPFDLEIAKEQREKEIAFENFVDQPNLTAQKSFTPDVQKRKSRINRKTIGNNQILDELFDLQAAKEQREKELLCEQQNLKKEKQMVSSTILKKNFTNDETTEIRSTFNEPEDKALEINTEIWSISSESEDNKTVGIKKGVSKTVEINSLVKENKSELFEADLTEKNTQKQRQNFEKVKRKRQNKKQVNVNIHIDSECEFESGGELITVEYESLETKEGSSSNIEISTESESANSFMKNCNVDYEVEEQNIVREGITKDKVEVDTEIPLKSRRRMRTQKKEITQLDRKKEFNSNSVDEIQIKETIKSYNESENVKTRTPEIRLRRVRFISNNVESAEIKDVQSNVLESDPRNQTHSLDLDNNVMETQRRGRRGLQKKVDHLKSIENLIVKETKTSTLTDTSSTVLVLKTKELENNITTDSDNKTSPQTKVNRRRRIKEKDVKKEDNIKDILLDSNPIKTSKTRRLREKPTINALIEQTILKEKGSLNPKMVLQISDSDFQVEKNTESDSDVKKVSPKIKVRRLRNTKLRHLELNTGSDITTDAPNSSIESSENCEPNNQLDYKLKKTRASGIIDSDSESDKNKTTSKLKGRRTQKSKIVESKSNENILKEVEQNVGTISDLNKISPKIKGRRGRIPKESNLETSAKNHNLTSESKTTINLESTGFDIINDAPNSSIENSENFEPNNQLSFKLNKTKALGFIDSGSESDKNKITSKLRGRRIQKSKIIESKSNENILKKEVEQNVDPISDLNKISPKIKERRGRIRKENNSETSVTNLNLTNESKHTTNVESNSSESLEKSEPIMDSGYGLNKVTKPKGRRVLNLKENDSESNVNLNLVDGSSSRTIKDSSESFEESEPLIELNLNKKKIPIENKKRRGRSAKVDNTETIENYINLTEKLEVISSLTETEKSGIDVDSNSDSNRTPPKTRKNLRQQKKADEIRESIETPTSIHEPIFKTPSSVAPKSRAARRLRSNSTSTPVMLDDSSIEQDIKIGMPARRLRSNSITTLMNDESLPLTSEIEKDKESDSEVNKASPKIRGRRRRKVELDEPKIEKDVITIQKECLPIRASRRLRSNSTCTPIVIDESAASIEKAQVEEKVSDKEQSKSSDENLVLSEIETEDSKISTKKSGRGRRNAKNILQSKITENVDIKKVNKDDSQDEISKNIKDVSETIEVVEMDIENEIKITATKATRTRTNKRKLHDTEEQSNDSEPGPVTERRTTRRRK